jgi:hypothetical protein
MTTSAQDAVLAWNERYSRRDVQGATEFMSEDFVRLGDGTLWTPVDLKGWVGIQTPFFDAFPDWSWEIQTLLAADQHVAIEFYESGTFTMPYHMHSNVTFEPTGESYTERSTVHFEVNSEGKVSEIRAYYTNNIRRVYDFGAKLAAKGVTFGMVHGQATESGD